MQKLGHIQIPFTRFWLVTAVAAGGLGLSAGQARAARGGTGGGGPVCALPDLVTVVPAQIQLQDTSVVAEGKKGAGKAVHVEFLRFSNNIANVGAGPLEVMPTGLGNTSGTYQAFQNLYDAAGAAVLGGDIYRCDPDDPPVCTDKDLGDAFFFHETHNHYHLEDVALFAVHAALDDGTGGAYGAQVGASTKQTFCLIDYVPLEGTKPGSRTYYDCLSTDQCWRTQGIGVGWADEYHQPTDFQGMEITNASDGIYYLVSTANHAGLFVESDYENNTAWASFELYTDNNDTNDSNGNRNIRLIWHSACEDMYGQPIDLCGKDWGGFPTNR